MHTSLLIPKDVKRWSVLYLKSGSVLLLFIAIHWGTCKIWYSAVINQQRKLTLFWELSTIDQYDLEEAFGSSIFCPFDQIVFLASMIILLENLGWALYSSLFSGQNVLVVIFRKFCFLF